MFWPFVIFFSTVILLIGGFSYRLIKERDKTSLLNKQLKEFRSQKKSSEVRLGLIAEQLAPFLEGFPKNGVIKFLGQPIDYIVFTEDSVVFVEVKSGEAKLNKNQKRIRDLVKEGKVSFQTFKIKGQ